MGHIVEVQHMEKMNRQPHIKKIDKDTYIDLKTGEIKEFNHSETRKDNLNSIRQTIKKLRYRINANFEGLPNELFVTLTYRGELQTTDHKRVGKDYNQFIKRMKRKLSDLGHFEAIRVLEPHGSGKWHMHVLFKFTEREKIYLPNEKMSEIWGNGFVRVNSLKDVDNIGAYLSAYLTDIELRPETELLAYEREIKEVDNKKYIKGGRLEFYPSGVNLYSCTRGIKKPTRKDMIYKDIKKVVGSTKPHYQNKTTIQTDDFENTIKYEQYNTKRSCDL